MYVDGIKNKYNLQLHIQSYIIEKNHPKKTRPEKKVQMTDEIIAMIKKS